MVMLGRLVWLSPGRDEALRFDAQGIGDAGDVVEVGDDLDGVMNGAIIEAQRAQGIQVGRPHAALLMGQPGGKFTQGAIHRRQRGLAPVTDDGMHERVGRVGIGVDMTDLDTEIVGVGLRSVVTAHLRGHNRRQHFALHAAEGRFAMHDDAVEADAGLHGARVDAHDVDDAPDATRAFQRLLEEALQQAGRFVNRNLANPGPWVTTHDWSLLSGKLKARCR